MRPLLGNLQTAFGLPRADLVLSLLKQSRIGIAHRPLPLHRLLDATPRRRRTPTEGRRGRPGGMGVLLTHFRVERGSHGWRSLCQRLWVLGRTAAATAMSWDVARLASLRRPLPMRWRSSRPLAVTKPLALDIMVVSGGGGVASVVCDESAGASVHRIASGQGTEGRRACCAQGGD